MTDQERADADWRMGAAYDAGYRDGQLGRPGARSPTIIALRSTEGCPAGIVPSMADCYGRGYRDGKDDRTDQNRGGTP